MDEYVLYHHTPSDMWSVMGRQWGADYWTQVCKWYKRKAYAERQLERLRKGDRK